MVEGDSPEILPKDPQKEVQEEEEEEEDSILGQNQEKEQDETVLNDVDKIEEIKLDVDDDEDDHKTNKGNGGGPLMHSTPPSDAERTLGTETEEDGKGGETKKKSSSSFLRRLFDHRKKTDTSQEKAKDPEAGTELLGENKFVHNKSGKNGDIEIEAGNDVNKEGGKRKGIEDLDDDDLKPTLFDRLLRIAREQIVVVGVLLVLFFIVIVVVLGLIFGEPDKRDGYLTGRYVNTVTQCGKIQGVVEDGALAFRGIPYSVPPIGENRWKPSELVQRLEDCWTGTYHAHNHTKLCYQKPLPHPYGDLDFSEDCLYLDVYTPRVTYDDPMPVVVYFAGDSFQGHDSIDFKWRPSAKLAREKQVVFVVVYYRMNAFGFLALELLTKNVHPPTSGNYGFHDMLTSLKWVHQNIEDFGGNTAKVTILGHGSGGTGVLALLSSRLARLYFNQAWISGGSAHFVNKTLREVERNNEAFNRHLMCETTECLYSKTPEQILNAIPVTEWPFWGVPNYLELPTNDEHTAAISVVDGAILYDIPSVVWENNDFVDVAVVIGSSIHSISSRLMDEDFEDFDWEQFNKTVKSRLGTFGADVVESAIEIYYNDEITAVEAYVTMLSDLRVTCPLLNLAYRASKIFTNNVYFYLSTYVPDGNIEYVNLSYQMAAHGLEIAAIFDLIPEVLSNPTATDLLYQKTVQDMFYYFVEHGKPSEHGNPKMPWKINYVAEELDSSAERYVNCDFWTKSLMYPKHARMN